MLAFDHFNFNVLDLEKSKSFYEKALGLKTVREIAAPDGSFVLSYLGDGVTGFLLELTWLRDRGEPYDLGESEFHLALKTNEFERLHKLHTELDCICFENDAMGIYFIEDPDGYWIEIVPERP